MPKPKSYTSKDVIAVDVNERKIVRGSYTVNIEEDTGIDRAYRYKVLAENLQRKYSSTRYLAWRRRRGILDRVRSYHEKAKNIIVNLAKKNSHEIVKFAKNPWICYS